MRATVPRALLRNPWFHYQKSIIIIIIKEFQAKVGKELKLDFLEVTGKFVSPIMN